MALKATIIDDSQEQLGNIYEKVIKAFYMAGEQFIVNAREQASSHSAGQYEDITANLRNSVAYFIIHNGEIINKDPAGDKSGKENEGKLSQAEIALMNEQLIKDIVDPSGFQLIVLAGMNYASYVESKGYNVISYQADVCFVELARYLENLDLIEGGTAGRMEEGFIPDDLPG